MKWTYWHTVINNITAYRTTERKECPLFWRNVLPVTRIDAIDASGSSVLSVACDLSVRSSQDISGAYGDIFLSILFFFWLWYPHKVYAL